MVTTIIISVILLFVLGILIYSGIKESKKENEKRICTEGGNHCWHTDNLEYIYRNDCKMPNLNSVVADKFAKHCCKCKKEDFNVYRKRGLI